MTNRYTVKRLNKEESPYVDWALRCQYAVETIESITAPAETQILELELLWLGG